MKRFNTTVNSGAQCGQAILEFVLSAWALLFILSGMLAMVLFVAAKVGIQIEAYTLARAHLYGNELGYCQASQYWPQKISRLELNCDAQHVGEVSVEANLSGFGFENIAHTKIKLKTRSESVTRGT